MEFIDEKIMQYASMYTTPEPALLHKLYRETNLKSVYPSMLSGHTQGMLLRLMSVMLQPKNILEIGTFTGYSAICMADGLQDDGKLYTIEINPEMEEIIMRYFGEAGLTDKIELIIGDAIQAIQGINKTIDLVFIDGDKEQYVDYYESVLPLVRKDGIILADNVLWSGKVLGTPGTDDKETKGILRFNDHLRNDARVEIMTLPFRDGLMIIRKK